MSSDSLAVLPTDNTPLSDEEQRIVKNFMTPNSTILRDFRAPIILGLLFAGMTLPSFDAMLNGIFNKNGQGKNTVLMVKIVLFILLAFAVERYVQRN